MALQLNITCVQLLFSDNFQFALKYLICFYLSNSRMADLLTLPNQQLARRVIGLSLRANELSNAIQLSKEHMEKVRGDKARSVRMEKQTGQTRLKEQKGHYESIVARHQGFIEQVLDCYIFESKKK